MREILRYSLSGHGWIIWVTCFGTILAGLVGWFALSCALLAVELVALVSLSAHERRRHEHP
jgi:cytochrome oxidase assembly protein ShyY1